MHACYLVYFFAAALFSSYFFLEPSTALHMALLTPLLALELEVERLHEGALLLLASSPALRFARSCCRNSSRILINVAALSSPRVVALIHSIMGLWVA